MMSANSASETQKVVILTFGQLKLILPQGDIRTVESIVDVDTQDPLDNSAGWINFGGQAWPAYCLSQTLTFITQAPQTRRACVILALPDGYLGLICDDASVLVNFAAQVFELPPSMRLSCSPLYGLANIKGELACVSNASRLADFVMQTMHHQLMEPAL